MVAQVTFSQASQAAIDVFEIVVAECELSDCTTTAITGQTSTGDVVVFSGSFSIFIDPVTGECIPTGGTISGMEIICGGLLFLSMSGVSADFNTFATAYDADDLGGWFADLLIGGSVQIGSPFDDDMFEIVDILVGNDEISAGNGDDRVFAGTGNDTITGGADYDTAGFRGSWRDFGFDVDIYGNWVVTDQNAADGSEGTDQLYEMEAIEFTDGIFELWSGSSGGTLFSSTGADLFVVEGFLDYTLYTGSGNDVVFGAFGNDTLDGGVGADYMAGGVGNDSYFFDNAGDEIVEQAGEGFDVVYLAHGGVLAENIEQGILLETAGSLGGPDSAGVLAGNSQSNLLTGNNQDNFIGGRGGSNLLYGADGNDQLAGGQLADLLNGQQGDDAMIGYDGSDILLGEFGNDILDGGNGFDFLAGGFGDDTFRVGAVEFGSADFIADFGADNDTIGLQAFNYGALGASVEATEFTYGTAASTSQHRLIFDTNTGNLYYDADGSGSGFQFHILTIQQYAGVLNFDDFELV